MHNEPNRIRHYVIADDYKWLYTFDNHQDFLVSLSAHVEVMRTSKKDNTFRIFTIDLSEDEAEIVRKNKAHELRKGLRVVK